MKKSIITVTVVSLTLAAFLMFSSFKNNESIKQTSEPIKTGFYMNDGCTKVDSITCYGYSDFYFIHEITPEMLTYDRITYEYAVASEKVGHERKFSSTIEGKVFNGVVGNKSVVKIPLSWNLKYTTKKEYVNNSYFKVTIYGSMISGYQERWNESTSSIERTPTYQKKAILLKTIPLFNREFFKTSVFSGFTNKPHNIPVEPKSQDCYPCLGEKPEVYEFSPGNY